MNETLDLRDIDSSTRRLRVVSVPDGFVFRTLLPPGAKFEGEDLTDSVVSSISPAEAMALIVFLQDALELTRATTVGPYTRCPKCKLWIHNAAPVKHNCP